MTDQPQAEDPIELLREQVRAATDAAERLVRETGTAAPPPGPSGTAGPGAIPENGWEAPRSDGDAASELQALGRLFETVRDVLPEDLQRQVTELIRQLLLVLRALIDWAVGQIETGPRGRSIAVEDIPIA